ncbi:MAG: hypothetical protein ACXVRM_05105 [Solirubrobacteraceae bacterium]
MEEAEHLCDRVALIDQGRVIALDRPAALAGAAAGTRLRLRAPEAAADELLRALPGVTTVERHGADLVVSGSGDLVTEVVLALDRGGLRAEDVRPETARLEDAFLALTDEATHAPTNQETSR